jgi:hypothetical protein
VRVRIHDLIVSDFSHLKVDVRPWRQPNEASFATFTKSVQATGGPAD